jgi:hypothetical protein
MNCKPGDLAYTVGCRNAPEVNGHVVEVVELVGPACWLVRGEFIERNAAMWGVRPHVFDKYLRPIRDNDGEDETLTWAPRRQGVEA